MEGARITKFALLDLEKNDFINSQWPLTPNVKFKGSLPGQMSKISSKSH